MIEYLLSDPLRIFVYGLGWLMWYTGFRRDKYRRREAVVGATVLISVTFFGVYAAHIFLSR
jgi:hypothetical protein